jgi:hypothetical protein
MMMLLLLRLTVRLEIRAIAALVFMKYPATVKRGGCNGANEKERKNFF